MTILRELGAMLVYGAIGTFFGLVIGFWMRGM